MSDGSASYKRLASSEEAETEIIAELDETRKYIEDLKTPANFIFMLAGSHEHNQDKSADHLQHTVLIGSQCAVERALIEVMRRDETGKLADMIAQALSVYLLGRIVRDE